MVNGDVLVLNRSWIAVNITTVKRAMVLLFQGHACVVHPRDYTLYDFNSWCEFSQQKEYFKGGKYIITPSMKILLPDVILLTVYNGFMLREVRLCRKNIFERDRCQCQYCGKVLPKHELTIDHVIPRSRGGEDTWENLVLACVHCNLKKGSMTPKNRKCLYFVNPLPQNGYRS
jgi:5-methylcytosine-specific restriction endonuclease McrA